MSSLMQTTGRLGSGSLQLAQRLLPGINPAFTGTISLGLNSRFHLRGLLRNIAVQNKRRLANLSLQIKIFTRELLTQPFKFLHLTKPGKDITKLTQTKTISNLEFRREAISYLSDKADHLLSIPS
ncbi:hypothetical protein AK812_SmicGene26038 [Symbiodinium microadriaticum]|uniref:Uncharacterized protein n=1 Tax=Symbiodinium microadriaticum TaxID=2951 RepID=A0A1Q9DAE7_SYMMI|nr:hypothetical protein AK812_SmicGene26038 [Symbiodinium microadriaticum]